MILQVAVEVSVTVVKPEGDSIIAHSQVHFSSVTLFRAVSWAILSAVPKTFLHTVACL